MGNLLTSCASGKTAEDKHEETQQKRPTERLPNTSSGSVSAAVGGKLATTTSTNIATGARVAVSELGLDVSVDGAGAGADADAGAAILSVQGPADDNIGLDVGKTEFSTFGKGGSIKTVRDSLVERVTTGDGVEDAIPFMDAPKVKVDPEMEKNVLVSLKQYVNDKQNELKGAVDEVSHEAKAELPIESIAEEIISPISFEKEGELDITVPKMNWGEKADQLKDDVKSKIMQVKPEIQSSNSPSSDQLNSTANEKTASEEQDELSVKPITEESTRCYFTQNQLDVTLSKIDRSEPADQLKEAAEGNILHLIPNFILSSSDAEKGDQLDGALNEEIKSMVEVESSIKPMTQELDDTLLKINDQIKMETSAQAAVCIDETSIAIAPQTDLQGMELEQKNVFCPNIAFETKQSEIQAPKLGEDKNVLGAEITGLDLVSEASALIDKKPKSEIITFGITDISNTLPIIQSLSVDEALEISNIISKDGNSQGETSSDQEMFVSERHSTNDFPTIAEQKIMNTEEETFPLGTTFGLNNDLTPHWETDDSTIANTMNVADLVDENKSLLQDIHPMFESTGMASMTANTEANSIISLCKEAETTITTTLVSSTNQDTSAPVTFDLSHPDMKQPANIAVDYEANTIDVRDMTMPSLESVMLSKDSEVDYKFVSHTSIKKVETTTTNVSESLTASAQGIMNEFASSIEQENLGQTQAASIGIQATGSNDPSASTIEYSANLNNAVDDILKKYKL